MSGVQGACPLPKFNSGSATINIELLVTAKLYGELQGDFALWDKR